MGGQERGGPVQDLCAIRFELHGNHGAEVMPSWGVQASRELRALRGQERGGPVQDLCAIRFELHGNHGAEVMPSWEVQACTSPSQQTGLKASLSVKHLLTHTLAFMIGQSSQACHGSVTQHSQESTGGFAWTR